MRTKEILLNKFETLKTNLSSIKDEIQSTIDEIGECLDIVSANGESMPFAPLDDEEMEEFRCSELRQIPLDSLKEGKKVKENNENKTIGSKDSTLKDFIDIRNRLQLVKKKCEESGCALPKTTNNEDENIWEEGGIESLENNNSGPPKKQGEDRVIGSTSNDVKNEASGSRNNGSNNNEKPDCEGDGTDPNPLRTKLLVEAPVMKWGYFLDNWGLNQDVLANQRGLELEGHW
ncbi:hypothetical protein F0562_014978 [Nyssa sinensis]|uniref:Uncharacterized protein n=1 Tax=Nyssa sinensis TaxID=561372 RepID=A0A5J4ZQM5_9ASTE|nr:hypothetical protein F0562_014978 [Nyssa sinensis]